MIQDYIHRIGWFAGLLLAQVFILNNIHIAGFATPFAYIYLVLKFPSDTGRKEQMLWAFALGLAVDLFADTPGMNAAASVLLAFACPTLLRLFVPRDMSDSFIPGFRTMGPGPFIKYVSAGTLLHHAMLYAIEYFSVAHLGMAALHILASSILTVAFIAAIEGIRRAPTNKER